MSETARVTRRPPAAARTNRPAAERGTDPQAATPAPAARPVPFYAAGPAFSLGFPVQAKLSAGQANDPYEREADAVAGRVTAGLVVGPGAISALPPGGPPQRADEPDGTDGPGDEEAVLDATAADADMLATEPGADESAADGEATVQPMCDECAAARGTRPGWPAADFGREIRRLRGSGDPLPGPTRDYFEPRFGRDLGGVRVHADGRSAALARSAGALAFTHGNDVFFGPSQFRPDSDAGRHLLAHELTHTIQQAGPAGAPPAPQACCGEGDEAARDRRPEAEVVQFQPEPGKKDKPAPTLKIAWQGSMRESLFAFLRHSTDTEEEAARLTLELSTSIDSFVVNGAAVGSKEEFEARTKGRKEVTLGPALTAALLKYFKTDLELLTATATLAGMAEEFSLKNSPDAGPTVKDPQERKEEKAREVAEKGPTVKVQADWKVLADNEDLAEFFLYLLQHYAGKALPQEVMALAKGGLTEAEVKQVIGDNKRMTYFAAVFTQGYREFVKAGGTDVEKFKPLEERIFEQVTWGNPTARKNQLMIGEGWPERGRLGIANRPDGVLYYDETGNPLESFAGGMMRDPGYIGAKQFSWGINITSISDPALKGILTALKQKVGDPARGAVIGAEVYFENIDLVNAEVKKGLGAEVIEKFEGMLPVMLGFLAGHGMATVLMRMPPPWSGIGLALSGLLKVAGYVLELDLLDSAIDRVLKAGYHLCRVQQNADKTLTKLSEYHLAEAAKPLRSLVADIAATVVAIGLNRFIRAVRDGERGRLKCSAPCDIKLVEDKEGEGKKGPKAANTPVEPAPAAGPDVTPETLPQVEPPTEAAPEPAAPETGGAPSGKGGWVRPKGWRLPKNGTWEGTPGDSNFKPTNPGEHGLGSGETIPFRNGRPDFSQWSKGNFTSAEALSGNHVDDLPKMVRTIAAQKGWTQVQVTQWLRAEQISPHHSGGNNFELIPWKLHANSSAVPPISGVRHMGGAYDLRNK